MRKAERLLVALASACAAAVLAYAVMRVAERALFPEPNPAMLIWSDRSGFAWRSLLAIYVGSLGGFGGYALASRAPRVSLRWLPASIVAAALALVAQGVIVP